jgi:hypothetical protein
MTAAAAKQRREQHPATALPIHHFFAGSMSEW